MMNKIIAFMGALLFAFGVNAQTVHLVDLVVDFEDDVDVDYIHFVEIENNIDLQPNSPFFSRTKIMQVTVELSYMEETINALRNTDGVESVEMNGLYRVPEYNAVALDDDVDQPEGRFPNDPLFNKHQWNFKMVGAQKAWKQSDGSGVIVAVIDTGVSNGKGKYPRVPDLAQTEIVDGFNFVNDTADPSDGNGHGTHVAGTIAQSTNNGIGVAGLAYKAKIMPIKVLSDEGWGTTADIAEGIIWAVDNGAHVINLSLGGGGHSDLLEAAVDYARDNNVFMACAAGNTGKPVIEYPASYNSCMAVSSVGKAGNLAFYSSYGEGKKAEHNGIFIAAPGGDQKADGQEGGVWQDTIVSGKPTAHGYFPFQGTSMATPHVAGIAALVISKLGPDDYSVEDVEEILAATATPKYDEFKYGAGIIDAELAVKKASDQKEGSTGLLTWFLTAVLSVFAVAMVRQAK